MGKKTVEAARTATCPQCKKMNAIGNGTRKDGKQRFLCKSCNHSFIETSSNNKYTRQDKRLLALLLSFLDADISNDGDFNEVLKDLDTNNFKLKNIKVRTLPDYVTGIECHNPKLLICKSGDIIGLIKIPDSIDKTEERRIKINDSPDTGELWQTIIQ